MVRGNKNSCIHLKLETWRSLKILDWFIYCLKTIQQFKQFKSKTRKHLQSSGKPRSAEPYLIANIGNRKTYYCKHLDYVVGIVSMFPKYNWLPLWRIQVQTVILACTIGSVARHAATMRSVQSAERASCRCIGGASKHVLFEYKTAHRNNTPESQSGERSLTPGLAKVRAS